MKNLAVAYIGAAAFLAIDAQAAVKSYGYVNSQLPGTCQPELITAQDWSMPCGTVQSKDAACPVVVPEAKTGDPTPVVDCDTYVKIGTRPVHGVARSIWGIVAGSAPAADLGTAAFGLSPGGFQQLCPFTCMNADDSFAKCVVKPSDCASGTAVKDLKLEIVDGTDGMLLGGFSQLGDADLAYSFVTSVDPKPILDHEAGDIAETVSSRFMVGSHNLYLPDLAPTDQQNCEQFNGNVTTFAQLSNDCGHSGKLPCILEADSVDECTTNKCKKITFYRPGVFGADSFCKDGNCTSLSTIQRQFKIVSYQNFKIPDKVYQNAQMRYRAPPRVWSSICPYVCGQSQAENAFLPICVSRPDQCVGDNAVPSSTVDYGGNTLTLPGSILSSVIAIAEEEEDCGNSAFGASAPGLLVLAVAAAVTMYSS